MACRGIATALALSLALCGCSGPSETALPSSHLDAGKQKDAGSSCTPLTCEKAGAQCGTAPDGCGDKIECGACSGGKLCGGGGPNRCGDKPCTAASCAALGAECGVVADGCSSVLYCGLCVGNNSCGAENRCLCTKKTCASVGAECGTISDGCGGIVLCGSCSAPLVCGGKEQNRCGQTPCVPTSCQAQGVNCGTIPDECDSTLDCGTCSLPLTCGGGGVSGKCGCMPTTCAAQGKECGSAPDGCGAMLDCGSCPAGKQCGAGGLANKCGCVPTTCAAQGKDCGSLEDGCGATLECGSCKAPKVCAGAGVANVCGCNPTACPPFYTNSFESASDLANWTIWHNCASDANWSVQRDAYPAPAGGSWGLRFQSTTFQPSCAYPGVYAQSPSHSATPGVQYRGESWSRNGGGVGFVSLLFFDGAMTQLDAAYKEWPGDSWQYHADLSVVGVAPPNTAYLQIRVGLLSEGSSADFDLLEVYVDP